jgi:membrane protease YdiL (CAAX protease family)
MTTAIEITRQSPRLQALKQIAVGILILAGIETLNQFLIVSGSALSHALQGRTFNARFWVGMYQQMFQAAAGILLYRVLFKKGMRDLGINLNNKARSLSYFGYFAMAWLGIIAIYLVSSYFLFPKTWSALSAAALPPGDTITATLIFQAIFPGLGEEILFRGLMLNLLAGWVFPRYKQHKASLIGMVLLSSFYFAAAHVYFQVVPFELTHFDPLQIVTALGCGAVYAVMFLKTKSLLAPFLSHNFANTTATMCGYLIASR